MASNLLNIVYQEPKPIDEEKLKFLCTKRYIWGDFKISSGQFNSIPEQGRMKLFYCLYTSISENFRNYPKMTMSKVIADSRDRSL